MARRRLQAALVSATVAGTVAVLASPASATTGWTLTGSYERSTWTSGQGLATVGSSLVYRGFGSIPWRLALRGWTHIGDPGHHGGDLFDAYQAASTSTATSKLFEVTTPGGQHLDFVHRLVNGEAANNSFAAVSPDGQWLVSGEYGTMNRLLVFPAPVLNPAITSSSLPLAGTISLNTSVTNVQGCDFASATQLVCSSDDAAKDVFSVNLSAPLSGTGNAAATVTHLFTVPEQSWCRGTFETEGIDYSGGILRVEMIPPAPCDVATRVYVYRATS